MLQCMASAARPNRAKVAANIMPSYRRAYLLVLGAAFSGVVFALGTSFTQGVESPERADGAWIFWLLASAVFGLPFWLPALVPPHYRFASRIIRWTSAAFALVPLWFAGGVALHQFGLFPGGNFSVPIFAVAMLLCVGCTGALAILVRSEAHKPIADAS
jgi:hypothetical protein